LHEFTSAITEKPDIWIICANGFQNDMPKLKEVRYNLNHSNNWFLRPAFWLETFAEVQSARKELDFEHAGQILGRRIAEQIGVQGNPRDKTVDLHHPLKKAKIAGEVAAGVIYGITDKKGDAKLVRCFQDADHFVLDVEEVVHDLTSFTFKGLVAGVKKGIATIASIPVDLAQCAEAIPEAAELGVWAAHIVEYKKVEDLVEYNIKRQAVKLGLEVNKLRKDHKRHEWFQVGEDIGEMIVLLTTPKKHHEELAPECMQREEREPLEPEFEHGDKHHAHPHFEGPEDETKRHPDDEQMPYDHHVNKHYKHKRHDDHHRHEKHHDNDHHDHVKPVEPPIPEPVKALPVEDTAKPAKDVPVAPVKPTYRVSQV